MSKQNPTSKEESENKPIQDVPSPPTPNRPGRVKEQVEASRARTVVAIEDLEENILSSSQAWQERLQELEERRLQLFGSNTFRSIAEQHAWFKVSLNEFIPKTWIEALESTQELLNLLKDFLELFEQALDIIQALSFQYFTDPIRALVQEILDELRSLIIDFVNTDIYWTAYYPTSIDDTTGFLGFTRKIAASFYDEGDFQRPLFTNNAFIGAVTFYVSSASLAGLKETFFNFIQLFKPNFWVDGFSDIYNKGRLLRLTQDIKAYDTNRRDYIEVEVIMGTDDFPASGSFSIGLYDAETFFCPDIDIQNGKLRNVTVRNPWPRGTIIRQVDGAGKDLLKGQIYLRDDVTPRNYVQRITLQAQDIDIEVPSDQSPFEPPILKKENPLSTIPEVGVLDIGGYLAPYDTKRYTDISTELTVETIINKSFPADTPVYISRDVGLPQSQFPDWNRVGLSYVFPSFQAIFNLLETIIAGLDYVGDLLDGLSQLIDLLKSKINWLQSKIDEINQAIDTIIAILDTTEAAALVTVTNRGPAGYIASLTAASNRPTAPDASSYSAGLVLLAGTARAFGTLLAFFMQDRDQEGLTKSSWFKDGYISIGEDSNQNERLEFVKGIPQEAFDAEREADARLPVEGALDEQIDDPTEPEFEPCGEQTTPLSEDFEPGVDIHTKAEPEPPFDPCGEGDEE